MNELLPRFELTSVYEDGEIGRPELIDLSEIGDDFQLSRRNFSRLTMATVSCLVLAGCGRRGHYKSHKAVLRPHLSPPTSTSSFDRWDFAPGTGFSPSARRAHVARIRDMAFCPDRKYLASASEEKMDGEVKIGGEIKIWSLENGALKHKIKIDATSVHFPANSKILVAYCTDQAIRVWDSGTAKMLWRQGSSSDVVRDYKLSKDGRIIATCGAQVIIWDLQHGRSASSKLSAKADSIAISGNGRYLACIAKNYVRLWDILSTRWITLEDEEEPTPTSTPDTSSDNRQSRGLAFTPDDRFLVAWNDGLDAIWSTEDGGKVELDSGALRHENSSSAVSQATTISIDEKPHGYSITQLFPSTADTSVTRSDEAGVKVISADRKLIAIGNKEGQIAVVHQSSGLLWKILSDPTLSPPEAPAGMTNKYTRVDSYGHKRTFTQPCGAPLPPGAICTCDCVATSSPAPVHSSGITESHCTCNQICTCVPVYR